MKKNTIFILTVLTIASQLIFVGGSALRTVNAEEVNSDSSIIETTSIETTSDIETPIEVMTEEVTAEPTPEALIEIPEPVVEPIIDPIVEVAPEFATEPIVESTPEVTPESTPEATTEPVIEAAAEPTPELVATEEVATEPVVEETAPAETTPVISPELTTDKADYQPGETVSIFGRFFRALENIVLKIFGGSMEEENYTETTSPVTTDEQGAFTYIYQIDNIFRPLYTVIANALSGEELARTTFMDPPQGSYNLDQASNGGVGNPPISPVNWENGNLNSSKAHYQEGQSVAYRVLLTGLPTSVKSTIEIEWDIRQSSKNAIDYITGPQRITETVDPTIGVSGLGSATYWPIPTPTSNSVRIASFNALPNDSNNKYLWGYNVSSVTFEPYVNGSDTVANSSTSITINVIPTSSTVVLAWGGHIAAEADWGVGEGATDVSGSPYHMRILELCNGTPVKCGGGNQDRSLAAAAVTPASTITIHKVTSNSDKTTGFTFTTIGTGYTGFDLTGGTQNQQNVSPGSYSVTETVPSGWGNTALTCTASGTGSSATPNLASHSVAITIGSSGGATIDCIYTNTLQQGTLIVKKVVVNDNGGTKTASDFSFSVNSGSAVAFEADGQNNLTVDAGQYTVTEPTVSGYTTTYDDCTDVTVPAGGSATCTITNDDIAPTLTLVKTVVNNNGGQATAANFQAKIDDNNVPWGVAQTISAGAHTASETTLSGYTPSAWGTDCAANGTITLALAENKTCTITNDDQQAYIIVDKTVVNDNGGSAVANNFLLTVDGNAVSDGVAYAVNPGAHTAGETNLLGYTQGAWGGDCNVNAGIIAALGETKTCTITNDDIAPTLKLVKSVTNNNGGQATPASWTLTAAGDANGFSDSGDSTTFHTVTAAVGYTLTESNVPGYTMGTWSCDGGSLVNGVVTLGLAQNVTCTITNDDIAPKLTLVKTVTNDNGGNKQISDFPLFINGSPVTSGQANTLIANTLYTATETNYPGYAASAWGGDCAIDGTITLLPGDNKTCTITNNDIAPKLKLVKTVVNDNGGTLHVVDFPLFIDGTPATSGTSYEVTADTEYTATETEQFGYAASVWGGDCASDGTITLLPGDDKTCTITNNDIQPTIKLVKTVVNDNGGSAVVADFPLFVDQTSMTSDVAQGFNAGTYTASETEKFGYEASDWTGDCTAGGSVTVSVGESKVCYITNDDIRPILHVIKHVINDNGGNAVAGDFTMNVTGSSPSPASFPGAGDPGTLVMLNAGAYSVDENAFSGYTKSLGANCLGNISVGEEKTCTITNNDISAHITLTKVVSNNHGGNAGVNDFGLTIGGTTVTSGQTLDVNSNTPIALNETGLTGYNFVSITGDTKCPQILNDTVTLNEDESVSCTITNDDIAPILTLVKTVVNNNGGNAVVADFPLFVNGNLVTSGVSNTLMANTLYTSTETSLTGYAASVWGGDCVADGTITLNEGDVKTCTITNNDIAPKLTLVKNVVNDNGGNALPDDFKLTIGGDAAISGTPYTLDANTPYALDETLLTGYNFVSITSDTKCPAALEGTVTLDEGEDITCTIKNDDIAPTITLNKIVQSNHGGNAQPGDFTLKIDNQGVNQGVTIPVTSNTAHSINEALISGYQFVSITGDTKCPSVLQGTVTLDEGENITCTITNEDLPAKITLVKTVTNNNGGTAGPNDFGISINGDVVTSGVANEVNSNTNHTINETGLAGYQFVSITGNAKCPQVLGGTVTLNEGEEITCTITNDDIAPQLIIIKHVINDDGDVAQASDFKMQVNGTNVSNPSFPGAESPGTTVTLNAGSYSVDEANNAGYTKTLGTDCSGTIAVGGTKTCTITNNDIPHATRTQGFWQTHTVYTSSVFAGFGGSLTIGSKNVNTTSSLFAGFYVSISKISTGGKRSALDQARMQMLQQWLAAELNCKAFGCSGTTQILLTNAATAWAGTNTSLIKSYASQLDAYNNSNDALPISVQGSATPKTSQSTASASISFWDILP